MRGHSDGSHPKSPSSSLIASAASRCRASRATSATPLCASSARSLQSTMSLYNRTASATSPRSASSLAMRSFSWPLKCTSSLATLDHAASNTCSLHAAPRQHARLD
eukprot:365830-Chlamydomonas_euryale.AAC.10